MDDIPTMIVATLAVIIAAHVIPYLNDTHCLRAYPGPLLAKVTDLWLGRTAVQGHRAEVVYKLHQKYGKYVRLAPNHLSIADPDAVQIVYGHGTGTLKTEFYDPFVSIRPGLFSTRSRVGHARKRRLVSNIFSLKNVLEFEPHVRSNVTMLIKQWDRFCHTESTKSQSRGDEGEGGWEGRDGRVWLNCMPWMNYLAFDIIGDLVFGSPFGMLESCSDSAPFAVSQEEAIASYGSAESVQIEHCPAIQILHGRGQYSAAIGVFPTYWRPFLRHLPWFSKNKGDVTRLAGIAVAAVTRRLSTPTDRIDMLAKLIEATDGDSKHMDGAELTAEALTQLAAGSDTTANTCGAIVFYLARFQDIQEKLHRELDENLGADDDFVPSYNRLKRLPYLEAVLNEVLRFYSANGHGLPRYVPAGGLVVCGQKYPAGTVLSVPLYVLHHDKEIWGPDANEFQPERWLERDNASLQRAFYPFSFGPRSCIGRNLLMMELTVIIASLVRRYHFVLKHPGSTMKVREGFTRKPVDCEIGIRRRDFSS